MDQDTVDLITLSACTAAVIVLRSRKRRQVKKQRRIWTKQWLLERTSDRGVMHFVNNELIDDTDSFYGFLRMPPDIFHELLRLITPAIQKCDTVMRDCITPQDMLTVTLRYLASGRVQTIFNICNHIYRPNLNLYYGGNIIVV